MFCFTFHHSQDNISLLGKHCRCTWGFHFEPRKQPRCENAFAGKLPNQKVAFSRWFFKIHQVIRKVLSPYTEVLNLFHIRKVAVTQISTHLATQYSRLATILHSEANGREFANLVPHTRFIFPNHKLELLQWIYRYWSDIYAKLIIDF